jgi:hypothetical protein
MIAYIFLLFAFASAFMIVFPDNEAFALLPSAIIKVVLFIYSYYYALVLAQGESNRDFWDQCCGSESGSAWNSHQFCPALPKTHI